MTRMQGWLGVGAARVAVSGLSPVAAHDAGDERRREANGAGDRTENPAESSAERALLRAGRAGDRAALERLLALHQRSLFALCYGVLGHADDAEDAVQETFLRALRALPQFRGDAAFRTWLFRIALNFCLRWKATAARPALLFSPKPQPGQQLLPPGYPAKRGCMARGILESQREHRLRKKEKGFELGSPAGFPEGQPLTTLPEAQPVLSLVLGQTNLGQFTLAGGVGFAVGASPAQPLSEWREAVASYAYGGETTFGVGDPEGSYFIANENLATGASPTMPGEGTRSPRRDGPGMPHFSPQ